MGLHVAHHHVSASTLAAVPLVEHRIRFARSGHGTQVDTEPPALALVTIRSGSPLRSLYWQRSSQVAITQAVTPEQLLWIGTSLFAMRFVGPMLRHRTGLLFQGIQGQVDLQDIDIGLTEDA